MSYVIVRAVDSTELHWTSIDPTVPVTIGRYERCTNIIRQRAAAAIASMEASLTQFAAFPVTYDNSPGSKRNVGAVFAIPSIDASGLVSTKWQNARRRGSVDADTDAFRFRGQLAISIMVPYRAGDGDITRAADFIANTILWTDDGDVHFETPIVVQGVPDSSESGSAGFARHARTVLVPFYVDENNAKLANVTGADGDLDSIASVCRTRFETFIEDTLTMVVVYDNAPAPATPTVLPLIAVDVIYGDTEVVSVGVGNPARYRTYGILQMSINVRARTGENVQLAIADDIFDAFRCVFDRGVQFKTPELIKSVRVGAHWRSIVQVEFHAEQIQ